MLKLPKGFLEDEEREGFLVESEMKSYWAAQMEVLAVVDNICASHGLKYFAAYGTLLGAARHNGFIPWDDDMDIAMLREDYETFIKVCETEMPAGYEIYNIHTQEVWENLLSRILNSTSIIAYDYHLIKFHGCPYSVGLDVFPLDFMPDNLKEREHKDNYINLALKMAEVVIQSDDDENVFKRIYNQGLALLEESFKFKFSPDHNLINQLLSLTDFIASSYGTRKGRLVTNYWNYMDHSRLYIFHSLWFSEMIDLGYEYMTIKAPIGVEAVLNICYGNNFMTPVRGASSHEYPCYKSQREMLVENGLAEYIDEKRNFISNVMASDEVSLVKEEAKEPVPSEYLELFDNKKIILYVLNSANILRYERNVYAKIARAFEIFEDAKENIAVILAEDITFLATLNAEYPDLYEKYISLRQSIVDKGFGIVADNLYYDFASVCDAYYGDGTTVIGDFKKAGKPIMLQNYTL